MATDGASEKPRAMSSIIDFIPKLLLRTHHALHSNGEPFIGRHTEGENEPEFFFFLSFGFVEVEASTGSIANVWLHIYKYLWTL